MCYSYLITLKLLWLQLRAALGASAHVQGHALKSVDLLTLLLPCWVLWLWGGGPRDLVEGLELPSRQHRSAQHRVRASGRRGNILYLSCVSELRTGKEHV